jgi:PLP dependent protein
MIAENIGQIRSEIKSICENCGRNPQDVGLLGATKFADANAIQEAVKAGLSEFGENRLQDALSKMALLKSERMQWHFLGRIQTNKLTKILERFDVIESVDRLAVLKKAQDVLTGTGSTKKIFLQVNISHEANKGGFSYEEALDFFRQKKFNEFPQLVIAGLMGIGPHTDNRESIREVFKNFKSFFDHCRSFHKGLTDLSMGMSQDFDIAIEEGSTLLRVGTRIFGNKNAIT